MLAYIICNNIIIICNEPTQWISSTEKNIQWSGMAYVKKQRDVAAGFSFVFKTIFKRERNPKNGSIRSVPCE